METLYLIVKLYIVLLCENIISCEKKFQVEKTLENYYNNYVTINQISKKRSKNHHSKVQTFLTGQSLADKERKNFREKK